jgi:hypothetical protein
VLVAAPFLDFLEACCFEVPASPFFFLHITAMLSYCYVRQMQWKKGTSMLSNYYVRQMQWKKGTSRFSTHFDLAANEGSNLAPSSVGGSVHPFSICPNWKHLLHW